MKLTVENGDTVQLRPVEMFAPDHDTVLVGCPTYQGLEACLDEYLDAYQALHWPRKNLMLVDNTPDDGDYARSIRSRVEAAGGTLKRINPSEDWDDTFYRSWQVLATHAQWNGYTWVWSLEQDVIVPALALDTLLNVACYVQAPFVTHTYPMHNGKPGYYQGLGCTLMKTELLTGALNVEHKRVPSVEGSVYNLAKRNSHVVLHQLLEISHRDPDGRFWGFQGTTDDEVSVGIEA